MNEQWNYTVGVKYSHFGKRGLQQIILSRNTLNNSAHKFENNDESDPSKQLLNYNSREIESKLRLENTSKFGWYKISYGLQYEYVEYTNSTFTRMYLPSGITSINYSSSLPLQKAGGYVQISRALLSDRLVLSSGLRTDINDYSPKMNNSLDQLSPRFSVSYQFIKNWFLNANVGRYFQLPPYTSLGYRDSSNVLVNKKNNLKYISSDHLVVGIEHLRSSNTKISLEGFYKSYRNYPLLIEEQISLANLGSDFGVIGDEPVNSNSTGRSYGAELLIQQSIMNGYYGIVAYTYVRSEFTNGGSNYVPSSWDNRHILSLTGGKQLKKNWEVGVKFRYFSGAPFTPFDQQASARKDVWDVTRTGVPNYNAINTQRLPATHQLDIRIDKKYFLKKTVLNIYLDIQNLYNNKTLLAPYLTVVTDQNGTAVEDPNNSGSYLLKELKNESGTILPSIGMMWEF
ncbi:MAG: TonB-dependent receptor [Bacteroidetes bacterium]|nr:TonB-dependent receptor [Bacteroidota bacterium]